MRGKLVTQDGSNTLNVTDVKESTTHGYWRAKVTGDNAWGNYRSFNKTDWDFIEDRPSSREQVRALPIGTWFKSDAGRYEYVRVSKNYVAYHNPRDESDNAIVLIDQWWHDASSPITVIQPGELNG